MGIDINQYPYDNPIILTDDIYQLYGGDLTIASTLQRQAAYWMAEERASEDINTFLLRTIVTGTYLYDGSTIVLDHAYVHQLYVTRFLDYEDDIYYTVSGSANSYLNLFNKERGMVDISYALTNCNCSTSSRPSPYKVQIVYQTGLSSGTSFRPDVLLGLTTYASLILNEIVGYGNESPGDMGVQEFSNQQYREKRKYLLNTTFGNSAKAQFVHRMFTRLRKLKYVSL
jgi:hypothetical protein